MYDALKVSVKQPRDAFLEWLKGTGIEPTVKLTRSGKEEFAVRLDNLRLTSRGGWLNISGENYINSLYNTTN